jgi:hypothetical protein
MLSIIGWIVLGIVVIVISVKCWSLTEKMRNHDLSDLFQIILLLVIAVGLLLPFTPLILKDNDNNKLDMKTCEKIGGKFEVIEQHWNGKFHTDVYGCVKDK